LTGRNGSLLEAAIPISSLLSFISAYHLRSSPAPRPMSFPWSSLAQTHSITTVTQADLGSVPVEELNRRSWT
jgi:hypothetical protein